jgi:hypothetical protein
MSTTRRPRPWPPHQTTLRFTPTAWAKLLYLRDAGDTEIGGFGLSRPDDLLQVQDLLLVRQETGPEFVRFDDLAVAELFEQQIDAGRQPAEFGRIWIHTHPGASPRPSLVDEETFARAFGRCDWAVMAILACGGASYARLTWQVGPGGSWRIPVNVDYSRPFAGSDPAAWQAEYEALVEPQLMWTSQTSERTGDSPAPPAERASMTKLREERAGNQLLNSSLPGRDDV